MAEENYIQTKFKARYFKAGEITAQTKRIIFALHGYGQQAKYFIKKFEPLVSGEVCVVAPEGLSKFYLQGFSGRVGATWMTSEDRLNDIDNYLEYLNTLAKSLVVREDLIIDVIGFSQGGATASRWALQASINFRKVVLWAAVFPPDMDLELAGKVFNKFDFKYVYGTQDRFVTPEKLTDAKARFLQYNLSPEIHSFNGDHEINQELLIQILGD